MNRAARHLLLRTLERQAEVRALVLAAFDIVPKGRVRKVAVAEVVASHRRCVVSPRLIAEVTRAVLGIPGVIALRPHNRSMFLGLQRRDGGAKPPLVR